jgi:hypothetical protein
VKQRSAKNELRKKSMRRASQSMNGTKMENGDFSSIEVGLLARSLGEVVGARR